MSLPSSRGLYVRSFPTKSNKPQRMVVDIFLTRRRLKACDYHMMPFYLKIFVYIVQNFHFNIIHICALLPGRRGLYVRAFTTKSNNPQRMVVALFLIRRRRKACDYQTHFRRHEACGYRGIFYKWNQSHSSKE